MEENEINEIDEQKKAQEWEAALVALEAEMPEAETEAVEAEAVEPEAEAEVIEPAGNSAAAVAPVPAAG